MSGEDRGIAAYRGGAVPSRVSSLFALMRLKANLRSELEVVSGKVAEAVSTLTEGERVELIALLADEDARADQDINALRAEAQRIQAEEARSKHARPMQISLSRSMSRLIQAEAERCASRGLYMSAEGVILEALKTAYGSR